MTLPKESSMGIDMYGEYVKDKFQSLTERTCPHCGWVSQAGRIENAKQNLEAHYYYMHGIKPR